MTTHCTGLGRDNTYNAKYWANSARLRAYTPPKARLHAPKKPQPKAVYANNIVERGTARKTLAVFAAVLIIAIISGLYYGPSAPLCTLSFAFTGLILLQAGLRTLAVLSSRRRFRVEQDDEQVWPDYTVLVPLKDEAHMVAQIMHQLGKLDYPREHLQILLIVEEDDPSTRLALTRALLAQPPDSPFAQVIVPRRGICGPRTKPNALNIAMAQARGDFVTIYDAEDSPHPSQLKTAIRAFRQHPNWGALQAPLDYFNAYETQLSRQFALEYAAQFHVWIPFMVRLGLPFPLGGTSNHIRRAALNAVRGKNKLGDMYWDSYNVTEDADLSFRLSSSGWDIGYILPPTQEEAVTKTGPWIGQRTRWMKGFMQSWLVHMDRPFASSRNLGGGRDLGRTLRRQLSLQLTLGTVLLAGFAHTPICIGAVLWTAYGLLTQGSVPVAPLVYVSLIAGYGSGMMIAAEGARRMGKPKLMAAIPLMPFYWLLLAVPTWRALVDYSRRPFYWAKTTHGVTTQRVRVEAIKRPTINRPIKNPALRKPVLAKIMPPPFPSRTRGSSQTVKFNAAANADNHPHPH